MQQTLYFFKYNNYYNRIIKKYDTIAEYTANTSEAELKYTQLETSFNPGNGLTAKQVVNYEDVGDYLVVTETIGNIQTIISRWFIINCDRNLAGQITATLYRDVIADNFEATINAPCMIERAMLNQDDPMILNDEGMNFNQIKKSETPLMDETESAWVVGYIPKNSFTSEDTLVEGSAILDSSTDIEINDISTWNYYNYCNINPNAVDYYGDYINLEFRGRLIYRSNQNVGYKYYNVPFVMDKDGNIPRKSFSTYDSNPVLNGYYITQTVTWALDYIRDKAPLGWKEKKDLLILQSRDFTNANTLNSELTLNNLNGKRIKDTNSGLTYSISIEKEYKEITLPLAPGGNLFINLDVYLNKSFNGMTIQGTPNNDSFSLYYTIYKYNIVLTEISQTIKTTLNNNRLHLIDSPYDMFCIPYSDTLEIYQNGTEIFKANKSLAINIAIAIGEKAGSGNLYDIQLLPYCPVRYAIKPNGTFDIGSAPVNFVKDSEDKNVGVILWADKSSFTFNIPYSIELEDKKIESQTDFYRLCSPNFNGIFEFNAAMNDGVDFFNVDCTYKPFSPYIHVNPNFKLLFGEDYNDARGLVCGGDFSLPQVSNEWANYTLNNKNYNEIFDREVKNLKIQQDVSRTQEIVSGISSSVGVGVGAGLLSGNAAVGAISGVLSAAGGVADYALNEKLRNEQLSFKNDIFNLQLGNIKAIPNSLSKTTAFTFNNKIFPILEYYSCTDEERQALENKILYTSMKVGRTGTISEFLRNDFSFIQGNIIRINVDENYNFANEIANEIRKGVYMKWA